MLEILQGGYTTRAKRVYPVPLLQKLAQEYIPNTVFVHTSAEDTETEAGGFTLATIGGVVRQLVVEGNVLYADVEIVRNRSGKIIEELIKCGIRFVTSGVGSLNGMVVMDDYKLTHVVPNVDDFKPLRIKQLYLRKRRRLPLSTP